jgi:hypothetical protein
MFVCIVVNTVLKFPPTAARTPNNSNRDQGCNEAVLDCGSAFYVLEKMDQVTYSVLPEVSVCVDYRFV